MSDLFVGVCGVLGLDPFNNSSAGVEIAARDRAAAAHPAAEAWQHEEAGVLVRRLVEAPFASCALEDESDRLVASERVMRAYLLGSPVSPELVIDFALRLTCGPSLCEAVALEAHEVLADGRGNRGEKNAAAARARRMLGAMNGGGIK